MEIDYCGIPIASSPFELKTYDASRVTVSEIRGSSDLDGKPCEFSIDACGAGEGQLEIANNEGQVKNFVKQVRPGVYNVSFTPTTSDIYLVDVRFNQQTVPGKTSASKQLV